MTAKHTRYTDSAEFTAELDRVGYLLKELHQITGQVRWIDWMRNTDLNFNTDAVGKDRQLRVEIHRASNAFKALEGTLHSAE